MTAISQTVGRAEAGQFGPRTPVRIDQVPPGTRTSGPERSPAAEVMQRYSKALFALPGLVSISWNTRPDLDELRLNFRSDSHRALADVVLEDAVDGVRLLRQLNSRPEDPPQTGTAPTNPADPHSADAVRAVAAMPGVWNYHYASSGPWADGHVVFHTVDAASATLLERLVRPSFPLGKRPDGEPRNLLVHWTAKPPR